MANFEDFSMRFFANLIAKGLPAYSELVFLNIFVFSWKICKKTQKMRILTKMKIFKHALK